MPMMLQRNKKERRKKLGCKCQSRLRQNDENATEKKNPKADARASNYENYDEKMTMRKLENANAAPEFDQRARKLRIADAIP